MNPDLTRTLHGFRELVQTMIVDMAARSFTGPESDWDPTAFALTPEGLVIMGLDPALFRSADRKDTLAAFLREEFAELRAYRYALLLNTWHASADPAAFARALAGEVRTKDLPGAFEALTLIVGDGEQEVTRHARIERDGVNPPTLTPWMTTEELVGLDPDDGGVYETGRFFNLNEAMREVRL